MNVPLLDLRQQYNSLKTELDAALINVAQTQMLVLGPEVDKLECTLAEYCDARHAIGVSSGTDALLMALMALDISAGDEVILPTYSFFATAGVVARLGAVSVFVDSEPVTLNIDPVKIREAITPRTKAIIPVHLYGQAAAMDEIMAIADEHGIPVIEDAAQAIGTQFPDGRKVGSVGLMGCFSFYPTKNLGAFGDAGLMTTNDDALAVKLRQIRNHGMEPRYYHRLIGGNFRIDAIQAAVLNVKFPHLESWHAARRRNAELYTQFFKSAGLAEKEGVVKFDAKNKVLLPQAVFKSSGATNYHIYNQYVIRVEKRDELRKFLSDNSIGAEIYYPVPFHRQECFAYLQPNDSDFPVANFAAATSLALPIYPELTREQIEFVVEKIGDFLG
ncbi:MAG TPA: DegT/DnrJ/EryC1/StrS family aminotransferase [Patescibacteria group bacterium]|nr:DegT/DnrJ/EryC1/StrS family aminotransferase [Patescibacteria group bacterium]